MFSRRSAALGLLALAASWPSVVTALDPDICATITTNDQNTFTDNLQTNGLCKTHCQGKAAFAITKGYDCWCSNYAPAQAVQVDLSDCNFPCWGYPDEPCGGDNGEYSYVRLEDIQPSGTRGGDQPSSTASSKPSKTQDDPEPSEPPSTSDEPVTETEQAESETTASSSTKSSTKTTSEPTSSSVKTVTLDGTIKTVFVVPTEAPTSDGDSNQTEGEQINGGGSGGSGGGVSKGALAGIVVGVALGVIAILGVGLWFFFRRRRNQQQEEDYQEDPSIRGSSSGMMGSGNRPEMSMGGGSPGSPNTNSNRNSALMIDPRMDPFKQGLYVRSASHESINTLRDDHDYSRRIQQRTLRATNPDPEPAG